MPRDPHPDSFKIVLDGKSSLQANFQLSCSLPAAMLSIFIGKPFGWVREKGNLAEKSTSNALGVNKVCCNQWINILITREMMDAWDKITRNEISCVICPMKRVIHPPALRNGWLSSLMDNLDMKSSFWYVLFSSILTGTWIRNRLTPRQAGGGRLLSRLCWAVWKFVSIFEVLGWT